MSNFPVTVVTAVYLSEDVSEIITVNKATTLLILCYTNSLIQMQSSAGPASVDVLNERPT